MIAVNGTEISESAILAEMQYHPAATRDEAATEAAEALVVRELLLQRAATVGLTWKVDDPESEEGAIDTLLKQELKLPEPDPAAYRRYYENNRARFRSTELFEASHILYLAPRDDAAARARARASAEGTLAVLGRQPDRFVQIARAESRCSSAGEGGRLGQIAAGETTPEFDTFLQSLEDEQLCPVPVETDYGIHVLKLHQRITGRQFSFEEVEAYIASDLNAAAWRRAVSGYISLLAAGAAVQGVDIKRASSPLVQ